MCLFVVFSFHLHQSVLEPNDSWWLFCFVVCCRTTTGKKYCRIEGSCIGGDEEVPLKKKKTSRK
jgi:hypothetical protein